MTRLAFTADLHIDDRQTAGVDPATGMNRAFVDGLAVATWIADEARRRRCDALIVGGDFTERRRPEPWRVAKIGEALMHFRGRKVLVRGNHDQLHAGSSIADVLSEIDNAVGYTRPGIAVVGDVAIAVIPYLDRHWLRTQPGLEDVPDAEVYRRLGEQYLTIAGGLYADAQAQGVEKSVLVVHQGLSGGNMTEEQQAFLGDIDLVVDTPALAAIGFDAVLAGHFHLHQVLSADPLVAYAGSPQRVSFQEEHQAKGFLVVDTAANPITFEFVETPARRFVTLTGEQVESETVGDVADAVVRVVGLSPDLDPSAVRQDLERLGAFEVRSVSQRPSEAVAATSGGLGEGLSPAQALRTYFAGDPDEEPLVGLGLELLEAVA